MASDEKKVDKALKKKAKVNKMGTKKVKQILVSILDKHASRIKGAKSLDLMTVIAMENPFLNQEYQGDIDKLRQTIASIFDFSVGVSAAKTPNPVVTQMKGMVMDGVMNYVTGLGNDTKQNLGKIISDGMQQQMTPFDMNKKIEQEIGMSRNRAEMISRTEIMRASELGTYSQHLSDGMGFFTIDCRSSACRWCHNKAYQVYRMDQQDMLPPFHPRCACVTVYHRTEEQAVQEAERIKDKNLKQRLEFEKKGLYLPPDGTGPLMKGAKRWKDPSTIPNHSDIPGIKPKGQNVVKELDLPLSLGISRGIKHPTRTDSDGVYCVNGAGSPGEKGIKTDKDFARVHVNSEREYSAIYDNNGKVQFYAKGYDDCVFFDDDALKVLKGRNPDLNITHNHPDNKKWDTFSPLSVADIRVSIREGLPINAVSINKGQIWKHEFKFKPRKGVDINVQKEYFEMQVSKNLDWEKIHRNAVMKAQLEVKDATMKVNKPFIDKFNKDYDGVAYAKQWQTTGRFQIYFKDGTPIFPIHENLLAKDIGRYLKKNRPKEPEIPLSKHMDLEYKKELDKFMPGRYEMKSGVLNV